MGDQHDDMLASIVAGVKEDVDARTEQLPLAEIKAIAADRQPALDALAALRAPWCGLTLADLENWPAAIRSARRGS